MLSTAVDGAMGEIDLPASECFTVVIETRMAKHDMLLPSPSMTSEQDVYVDGERVAT